jgi:hypothetical protein
VPERRRLWRNKHLFGGGGLLRRTFGSRQIPTDTQKIIPMKIIAPTKREYAERRRVKLSITACHLFAARQSRFGSPQLFARLCSIGGGQAGLKKAGGGIFSPHLLQISALEKLTRLHFGHFRVALFDCFLEMWFDRRAEKNRHNQ